MDIPQIPRVCPAYASAFILATPGPHTTQSNEEFRDALWFRLTGLSLSALSALPTEPEPRVHGRS